MIVNATRADRLVDPRWADEAELAHVIEILDEEGVDHEVRHLRSGALPADVVLEVAEEVGASLIVVGLRRRTPVGKLVLGSTPQQILLRAGCPVLAIKT